MSDQTVKRRSAPIHAYVGSNGGGKSLALVNDTIPSLQMGRRVLSTCVLLDPSDESHAASYEQRFEAWAGLIPTVVTEPGDKLPCAMPHPLWVPLTRWVQLIDWRDGDLCLDEVTNVVDSRAHQSLPRAVGRLIMQMRRRNVLTRWSTPAYSRADVMLRQVTQAVTSCRGYLREPLVDEDGGENLWGANRWFLWRTYDALKFDEFDNHRREKLKPVTREFYRRKASKSVAQRFYDSHFDVLEIDELSESGRCLDCGGTRRVPKCECPSAREGEHRRQPARSLAPDEPATWNAA